MVALVIILVCMIIMIVIHTQTEKARNELMLRDFYEEGFRKGVEYSKHHMHGWYEDGLGDGIAQARKYISEWTPKDKIDDGSEFDMDRFK